MVTKQLRPPPYQTPSPISATVLGSFSMNGQNKWRNLGFSSLFFIVSGQRVLYCRVLRVTRRSPHPSWGQQGELLCVLVPLVSMLCPGIC